MPALRKRVYFMRAAPLAEKIVGAKDKDKAR